MLEIIAHHAHFHHFRFDLALAQVGFQGRRQGIPMFREQFAELLQLLGAPFVRIILTRIVQSLHGSGQRHHVEFCHTNTAEREEGGQILLKQLLQIQ